jgi:hypothetical protein
VVSPENNSNGNFYAIMKKPIPQELLDAIRRIEPPKMGLTPYKGESLHIGHLTEYTTPDYIRHAIIWNNSPYPELAIIIPTFHEIEYAAQEDIILDRNLLGHPIAACFQYDITIPAKYLKPIGSIPPQIMNDLKQGIGLKGLPYIDQQDLRWTFHEDLIEPLVKPQWEALDIYLNQVE